MFSVATTAIDRPHSIDGQADAAAVNALGTSSPTIAMTEGNVAFLTWADVTTGTYTDDNGLPDVYIATPNGQTRTPVSANSVTQATTPTGTGIGGIDARMIFVSDYDLLVAFTMPSGAVFRWSSTGTVILVSPELDVSGAPVRGHSPTIDDGGRVAFVTDAQLVPDDNNGVSDVYLHDPGPGTYRRLSLGQDGQQGNGDSYSGVLSGDGNFVTFLTDATNFGDTNGVTDVYVRSTAPPLEITAAYSGPLTPGNTALVTIEGANFGATGSTLSAMVFGAEGALPLPGALGYGPDLALVMPDGTALTYLYVPPGTPPGPLNVFLYMSGPFGLPTGMIDGCIGCLTVTEEVVPVDDGTPT